ncbi:MAG: T9SS type A sorting domain-containing protein, partial [Bacteroidota bacterium]
MKKFFLLPIICLLGWATTLNAQCVPDPNLADSTIVLPLPYQDTIPGSGIQDTACVGMSFSTTISVLVPETITISGAAFGVSAITTDTEGGIENLPASMSYTCDPPDCRFLPNEPGCLEITGTPTAEEAGQHDLVIAVTVETLVDLQYTLPDGNLVNGNYFLEIRAADDVNCMPSSTVDITENAFDLRIQPNPVRDRATINVNVPTAGDYDLSIFNAVGQRLQHQRLDLTTGQNQIDFDGSTLPNGIYVFTLQNGEQA